MSHRRDKSPRVGARAPRFGDTLPDRSAKSFARRSRMRVDRRLFLKGLVVGAAGLVVPKGLLAEEEPERRFWSLNPTLPDRVVNGDYEEWPVRQIGEDTWETVMLPRSTPF